MSLREEAARARFTRTAREERVRELEAELLALAKVGAAHHATTHDSFPPRLADAMADLLVELHAAERALAETEHLTHDAVIGELLVLAGAPDNRKRREAKP